MKQGESRTSWLQSERGSAVVARQREALAKVLPRLYGKSLLQIGSWGEDLLTLPDGWRGGVIGDGPDAQVHSDLQHLPLMPRCVDSVLLAHSLESAESAHRLLNECAQVLTSRGQIIILGFNPYSPWGLMTSLAARHDWFSSYAPLPPGRRLLRAGRVVDWLHVLNFEVLSLNVFGAPPTWAPRWQRICRSALPLYMVYARKRMHPMNPLGQKAWSPRARSVNVAGVPTARGSSLREEA